MQATRCIPENVTQDNVAQGARVQRQLGWYVAFALLTTLAEALFLLSSMPSWTLG